MTRRPSTSPAGRRDGGALLLTVALLLAVMAALAFSLTRAAGMDVQAVNADYDRRNAAYLAEAAVAAAKWTNQLTKCNAKPVALPATPLAGATLSAAVTQGAGKQVNIAGSATVGATGASRTLVRSNVALADLTSKEDKDVGGGTRDTYLDSGNPAAQGGAKTLVLTGGQSNALLFWPLSDIPGNSRVLSAQLTLSQAGGGSSVLRTVNVHRVTSPWDLGATWTLARPATAWNKPGGDYAATALASTAVKGAGAYTWDVTGIVDDWVEGRLVDNGFLLRLPVDGQSVTFASLEGAPKPVLHVQFVKQC